MPKPMSKKVRTLVFCALFLIVLGLITLMFSERTIEVETPEPLQFGIPLDNGVGHETVIYDIDSEVE